MLYIGIDPGNSGGLAVLDHRGCGALASPMPETYSDILTWLHQWDGYESRAAIEDVHAMPKQGVTSMFTFGQNVGALVMALTAASIPFIRVAPSKWQKEFSLTRARGSDVTITAKKNAHKARAQELFPQLKITHAIADALLIAEYCRRRDARL